MKKQLLILIFVSLIIIDFGFSADYTESFNYDFYKNNALCSQTAITSVSVWKNSPISLDNNWYCRKDSNIIQNFQNSTLYTKGGYSIFSNFSNTGGGNSFNDLIIDLGNYYSFNENTEIQVYCRLEDDSDNIYLSFYDKNGGLLGFIEFGYNNNNAYCLTAGLDNTKCCDIDITGNERCRETAQYINFNMSKAIEDCSFFNASLPISYISFLHGSAGADYDYWLDNITIYDLETYRENNTLPTFEILYNSSTICFNRTTAKAKFYYSINATDLEGDTIYYGFEEGYGLDEATDIITFDDVLYNVTEASFENFFDSVLANARFWLYCVSPFKNLDICTITDKTGVNLDNSYVEKYLNYDSNICDISTSAIDGTEQDKSFRWFIDEKQLYMLEVRNKTACNKSNRQYLTISNSRTRVEDFSNMLYFEIDDYSSTLVYEALYIYDYEMDYINITRNATETIFVIDGTEVYNTPLNKFLLRFDIDLGNDITFYIYNTTSETNKTILYNTTIDYSYHWLNFLVFESWEGSFKIDDIIFFTLGEIVEWDLNYTSPKEYYKRGNYEFRVYITDEYHLNYINNTKYIPIDVNIYCDKEINDDFIGEDYKTSLGALRTSLYSICEAFDNNRNLQSEGFSFSYCSLYFWGYLFACIIISIVILLIFNSFAVGFFSLSGLLMLGVQYIVIVSDTYKFFIGFTFVISLVVLLGQIIFNNRVSSGGISE